MHSKCVLISGLVLGSLCTLGCELTAPAQTSFEGQAWTTYTSPDKRVSFEYPSNLNLTVRPRQDPLDPQLALIMESPDQSLGLTLMMRDLEEPDPDWCRDMMDACLDDNTVATTPRESVTRGLAKGLRQEFKSGNGILAHDLTGLALTTDSVCVHFTCNYRKVRASELRPICQRIVDSVAIEPSASAVAVQIPGE